LREIDRTMSARESILHSEVTNLMMINQNAGITPVSVSEDLFAVLERAVYYAKISNGAFDPTVGPLVSLWGIGTDNVQIPEPQDITNALALVNWQELILDKEQGTAFLQRKGMELDLGGIAKGYAADEAARIAREAKAAHAIIDFGGNIIAMGARNSNKRGLAAAPWRVGIQDPLSERNAYIGILLLIDKSIVTSGVYERYFTFDGNHYHHILSTKNGYPVDNGLLSVTIVTDLSIDADGLSTAVFALGFEQGLSLVEELSDTEGIFVFTDRSVYITGGLTDIFTLTGNEYWMKESD